MGKALGVSFFPFNLQNKSQKMYAEKKLELSGVRRGEGEWVGGVCTKVGGWERVRKTGTE